MSTSASENIEQHANSSLNLQETISLLKTTLEATADGILVVNTRGQIVNFNNKFVTMWNIPNHIIESRDDKKAIDFVLDQLENSEEFLDKVQFLYNNPTEESLDELFFKDGRTFERYSKPQIEGDKVIGRVWSFRDVTKQRESRRKITENEERFRLLFDTSDVGIFTMKEKFEECNLKVCEMFECKKEEIIGSGPWEFSPEFQPDGQRSEEKAKELITNAMKGIPLSFYWKHKTKTGRLIDTNVSLKRFTHNSEIYLQAIVNDITDQIKNEKVTKALYNISESVNTTEDMKKLYEKIHEIIGGLMPANNFYLALYDEKTELLSFPYFVDEYDPPQPPKKLGKGLTEYILRTGKDILVDEKKDEELRNSGEVVLIGAPAAIWLGIALKLEGKTIGAMVLQDYENENAYGEEEKQLLVFVSEQIAMAIDRKRNIEHLKEITKELKQLNATKDKFFSIIAHDLKNPFITLLGYSEILTNEYYELDDSERIEYLEYIKSASEGTFSLLQNLLQWSRSQTGRLEFNPEIIDANDIAVNVISLIQRNAKLKGIDVHNDLQEGTKVFADKDMLETVIRNLMTNALKFTNEGGTIKINGVIENGQARLCISDSGVGMDDETKNGLFRIDKSISKSGTAGEEGTGLGLLLCKEFIQKHDGEIWVESEIGKGSSFYFTLPVKAE
ncbi:MAG: ATP-binding protein [Bacteroidota bacterium]|nr:PAS domain S-box protein [Bacteroidota bacterium]